MEILPLGAPLPGQETFINTLSGRQVTLLWIVLFIGFAAAQAILWKLASGRGLRLLPAWILVLSAAAGIVMIGGYAYPYEGLFLMFGVLHALPGEAAGLLCGVLWKKIRKKKNL